MAEELRQDDKSGESETGRPNRWQRRHLFQNWYKKVPKLYDPVWKAKARKTRKKRKKIIKQERRRNARLK